MSLTLGIVGLPNVGKSTVFNALTRANVLAANYPFATIEPNVGVVPIPDPRLDQLAEVFHSVKTVPAVVSFVDIAGIVKGASEGAGLGNKFLANIREADAICQVVRVFADDDVVHVDGRVDPLADVETINTELILADLQTLEKAIPRLEKEARNAKDRKPVLEAAQAANALLDQGRTLFSARATLDLDVLKELSLLTAKPFLYVFNADESVLTDDAKRAELAAAVAPADCGLPGRQGRIRIAGAGRGIRRRIAGVRRSVRAGPACVGAGRVSHPRPADLPDRRAEGIPGLDHQEGRNRAAGGRRHPHRFRARIHQGRGGFLRRPDVRTNRWPRPRPPARCGSRARTT